MDEELEIEEGIVFERLIHEDLEKGFQVKLVVNAFRGEHYLSLRKYFLSFDEGFQPTRQGVSMKYEMSNSFRLLEGLLDIIPIEECRELLEERLKTTS